MEELADYAALLDLGRPDFIEIKGVTYCGSTGTQALGFLGLLARLPRLC